MMSKAIIDGDLNVPYPILGPFLKLVCKHRAASTNLDAQAQIAWVKSKLEDAELCVSAPNLAAAIVSTGMQDALLQAMYPDET